MLKEIYNEVGTYSWSLLLEINKAKSYTIFLTSVEKLHYSLRDQHTMMYWASLICPSPRFLVGCLRFYHQKKIQLSFVGFLKWLSDSDIWCKGRHFYVKVYHLLWKKVWNVMSHISTKHFLVNYQFFSWDFINNLNPRADPVRPHPKS